MKYPWIALAAVICNVSAQIAMKYAGRDFQAEKMLAWIFSPWLLSALAMYGISFFLTMRIFAANPLSVASPVMAGATFLLIGIASYYLLGEGVNWQKISGMTIIFVGILVLTRS